MIDYHAAAHVFLATGYAMLALEHYLGQISGVGPTIRTALGRHPSTLQNTGKLRPQWSRTFHHRCPYSLFPTFLRNWRSHSLSR